MSTGRFEQPCEVDYRPMSNRDIALRATCLAIRSEAIHRISGPDGGTSRAGVVVAIGRGWLCRSIGL
jgi:hypothetical protein